MNIQHLISAPHHHGRALALATTALLSASCGTPSAPRASHPVAFQLAASTRAGGGASVAGLEITGVKIVIGAVALGNGDEYGCRDCSGNEQETGMQQQVVDVPIDGGSVLVATEPVTAGTYGSAEISIERPVGLPAGLSWPAGTTMQITGRYNGTAFQLPLDVTGSFKETLSPAVQVTGGTPASLEVRMTLPVASWFVANGATLDPTLAGNRALIESNVRASLQPEEVAGAERER